MNISQKNFQALLSMASKKLGTTPEQLQKTLESGSVDQALSKMNPADAANLQQALSNPKVAEKILSSPQAKAIFEKLSGNG